MRPKLNFLCFSINLWEKRQDRKHRFMLSLSERKDVNNVYYIEPPMNLARLIFLPFKELNTKSKRQRWLRALTFKKKRVKENFFLLTPLFILPFWRFYSIYKINRLINIFILRLMIDINILKNSVLWLYHPYDYCLLNFNLLKFKISCFDWAEDWSDFFVEFSDKRLNFIDHLQKKIVASADIVFTAWDSLKKKAKKIDPNSKFIPNASETEHFISTSTTNLPGDISEVTKPIIGYVGSITDRLDLNIINSIAKYLQKGSIVIIGNIENTNLNSSLPKKDNIYYPGPKPYDTLAKYIKHFEVGLIPYKPELTEGEPTKQYDYLACGIPVVSTDLKELYRINDYIYIEKNTDDFVHRTLELAEKDTSEEKKKQYQEFAKKNSWEARTQTIMNTIKNKLQEI